MTMRRTNVEYSSKYLAEYCTATFAKRVLCPVFSLRSFYLEKKKIKNLHNQNKALPL